MPIDDGTRDGGNDEAFTTADVATARSFAMLLGEADLVGHGWEVTEERSWPTGGLDPESEKSKRAVEAGGITAWRSLAEAGSPRTAWFEVVPYASPADAELSLRQVPRFFVGIRPARRDSRCRAGSRRPGPPRIDGHLDLREVDDRPAR